MYKFSRSSLDKLATAHTELRFVFKEALSISPIDFGISCGHRTEKEQNEAYNEGNSGVMWPNSRHNAMPSNAVDFFPWVEGEIPWHRMDYFYLIAGLVMGLAKRQGYIFTWGGAWNGQLNTLRPGHDEILHDPGHIQREEF